MSELAEAHADALRGVVECSVGGGAIDVRERQLAGRIDRHHVDVHVRHLFADDQHADTGGIPFESLREPDLLRDQEQV